MVPCLYDHDLQAKPGPTREVFVDALIHMGFWDPMSCHYYQWNAPPMGISSWTRIRLGWIDPSRIKVVKPGENLRFRYGVLIHESPEDKAPDLAAEFEVFRAVLSARTTPAQ